MAHFLDLATVGAPALRAILDDAHARKAARRGPDGLGWPKGRPDADAPLAGHVLAMIFERPSTRTRFSFDTGIRQLGGSAIVATASDMQLGRGETIADTARVLGRFVDAIMLRTTSHATLTRLADAAPVPVINGLSDIGHPCQIMADILTFEERSHRPVAGSRWAFVGDGNNVANSLIEAATVLGFELRLGVPHGYDPDAATLAHARAAGADVAIVRDAATTVAGADVVVTDTWVSMGQADAAGKLAAMVPFRVDAALMAQAAPGAMFMHCLPAHRGDEVTDAVLDGPQSAAWDEAENRLHVQKSILLWCLGALAVPA